ncbi:hypothetical protein [Vacuolonema iberomarrocanum]|uniref:hypothetical protein n=1 Tax=Vacuolonema iberomarrocanum TaxID=3454632 RepID=UPI0019F01C57|nr:hypothetical protein [filamentous cyanobacterium LEGE 07170]
MIIQTLDELAVQLLSLTPKAKLHIIQVLAQSLTRLEEPASPSLPEKLSSFFRQSPLAEAVASGELDLQCHNF